jgi:hypothetical protein
MTKERGEEEDDEERGDGEGGIRKRNFYVTRNQSKTSSLVSVNLCRHDE